MSDVRVRDVTRADARHLARAWEDAREYYSALDPHAFNPPDPSDAGLAEWLIDDLLGASPRDDCLVAVAEQDRVAVGFVVATVEQAVPLAHRQLIADLRRPRARIDALAVQRQYWRGGVGSTLVAEVERWSRQRGARLIRLTTYASSPLSVPFYDALGYEWRSVVFLKYLEPHG